jgi:putative molybdopterin biosynthesis protein
MPSRSFSSHPAPRHDLHSVGPVLTVDEVAEVLRVNAKTVYALVKRGKLRAFRVGRALRCRRAEVARFIEASEATTNLQPARVPTE